MPNIGAGIRQAAAEWPVDDKGLFSLKAVVDGIWSGPVGSCNRRIFEADCNQELSEEVEFAERRVMRGGR